MIMARIPSLYLIGALRILGMRHWGGGGGIENFRNETEGILLSPFTAFQLSFLKKIETKMLFSIGGRLM